MLLVCTPCAQQGELFVQTLASILANYGNIQLLWEIVVHATSDTEMKTRIQGVASQMHTLFFFSLILCQMILRHTDKLSQTQERRSRGG